MPRIADRAGVGRELAGLTGLRFLAALWVVGYHTMPRTGLPRPVVAFWEAGFSGVSLFFVLSGFILAHVYGAAATAARPFPTRSFLIARFARVYPAYAVALVLTLPAFVRALQVKPDAPQGTALAGVCLSSITLTQAWIPGWGCWWNCPGWSLSAEAFLYLSFPFLATRLLRMRPSVLATVAVGSWLAALLVGRDLVEGALPSGASHAWLATHLGLTAWTPLVRLPEFVLGLCAARLLRRDDGTPRVSAVGGWIAAVVVAAVTSLPPSPLRSELLWPGLAVPFAIIIAALSGAESRTMLTRPLLQRLGNASYSLYLIHVGFHGYLLALINRTIGRGYDERWWVFALYLPIVVGLSLLMHDLVEVPSRRRLRAAFSGAAA